MGLVTAVNPDQRTASTAGTWTGRTYDRVANSDHTNTAIFKIVVNEDITAAANFIKTTSGGTDLTEKYLDVSDVSALKSGHEIYLNPNHDVGYVNTSTGSFTVHYSRNGNI